MFADMIVEKTVLVEQNMHYKTNSALQINETYHIGSMPSLLI